jgi:hypothetical protein
MHLINSGLAELECVKDTIKYLGFQSSVHSWFALVIYKIYTIGPYNDKTSGKRTVAF